ncbi:hypothetical protein A4A49_43490 [Nicotiana attenuata]|uniref:Uncharacterized protein n=1 Tax=Nicotiana attenuata TaxID=49451 RepID=A0A1J6JLZ1_NICAT|nr:hypothetical protein A4A49_43490 [Nicotiana attenuata]
MKCRFLVFFCVRGYTLGGTIGKTETLVLGGKVCNIRFPLFPLHFCINGEFSFNVIVMFPFIFQPSSPVMLVPGSVGLTLLAIITVMLGPQGTMVPHVGQLGRRKPWFLGVKSAISAIQSSDAGSWFCRTNTPSDNYSDAGTPRDNGSACALILQLLICHQLLVANHQ